MNDIWIERPDLAGREGAARNTENEYRPEDGGGAEEVEYINGRIKWFNAARGYGFIVPSGGGGDVLFHYNLLAGYDRKMLVEGALVRAVVGNGPRGRQARMLLEIDPSAAISPDSTLKEHADNAPPKRRAGYLDPLAYIDQAGPPERAQVRWFNRVRGYGFLLAADNATQIFVHMETVRRGGFEMLHAGEFVYVRTAGGPRGLFAVTIAPCTDAPPVA